MGWESIRNIAILTALDNSEVLCIWSLFVTLSPNPVIDEHRLLPRLTHTLARARSKRLANARSTRWAALALRRVLAQPCFAVRAVPLITHFTPALVHSHIPEDHLTVTLGTEKDIGPDGVVDAPHALAVAVPRLIHPAAFIFHFGQDAPRLPLEGLGVPPACCSYRQ